MPALINFAASHGRISHSRFREISAAVRSTWALLGLGSVDDSDLLATFSRGLRRQAPPVRHHVAEAPALRDLWLRVRDPLRSATVRDRAIFLSVVDGLLRASDAARLSIGSRADIGPHISFRIRGPKEQALLAQPAAMSPPVVFACTLPKELCSACALRAWLAVRPHTPGVSAVFVAARHGTALTADACSNAVTRILRAGGLTCSTHALRGLGASTAVDVGVDADVVRRHGRWRSVAMLNLNYRSTLVATANTAWQLGQGDPPEVAVAMGLRSVI